MQGAVFPRGALQSCVVASLDTPQLISLDFLRAFSEEISTLPDQARLIPPLPSANGHAERISSPLGPRLQPVRSPSSRSTLSDVSNPGYVIPPLRVGIAQGPVDMSSIRRPPSVPATARSSPNPISASRSSGQSSLASLNPESRALSIVDSHSGRSESSQQISEGTVGEDAVGVEEEKKETGLKRLGSLMRRKER